MSKESSELVGLLLPVNRDVSMWVSLFAVSLALLGLITQGFVWFAVSLLGIDGMISIGRGAVLLLCLAAVLGATVNGYANDDLLTSVLIAVAPLVGLAGFNLAVTALESVPGLPEVSRSAVVWAGGAAVAGTLTSLCGVVAGRVYGGNRSDGDVFD